MITGGDLLCPMLSFKCLVMIGGALVSVDGIGGWTASVIPGDLQARVLSSGVTVGGSVMKHDRHVPDDEDLSGLSGDGPGVFELPDTFDNIVWGGWVSVEDSVTSNRW